MLNRRFLSKAESETIGRVLDWKGNLDELVQALNSFDEMRGYELVQFIGAGVNGAVFKICHPPSQHDSMILKVFRVGRNEGQVQKAFARYGLAPQVRFMGRLQHFPVESKSARPLNFLGMDEVDTTLEKMLNRRGYAAASIDAVLHKVMGMLDTAYHQGLTHGDLHWDNIGLQFRQRRRSKATDEDLLLNSDYVFLDFGEAHVFGKGQPAYPLLLDLLQLYRNARLDSNAELLAAKEATTHAKKWNDIRANWTRAQRYLEKELHRRYPTVTLGNSTQVHTLYKNQRRLYDATGSGTGADIGLARKKASVLYAELTQASVRKKHPLLHAAIKKEKKVEKKVESKSEEKEETVLPEYVACHGSRFCGIVMMGTAGLYKGFEFLSVPAGYLLFRGMKSRSKRSLELSKTRPGYFLGPPMALEYAEGLNEKCQVFITTREAKLINLLDPSNLALLFPKLGPSDRVALTVLTGWGRTSLTKEDFPLVSCGGYYINKPVDEFAVCTTGYVDQAHKDKGEYVSIQVAKAVGDLGFDGWYTRGTEPRVTGNVFHHEMMLRKPREFMQQLSKEKCRDYLSKKP